MHGKAIFLQLSFSGDVVKEIRQKIANERCKPDMTITAIDLPMEAIAVKSSSLLYWVLSCDSANHKLP
ncbi:hypothetical protein C7B65_23270 [Phormidesmis priestleyi ULC007]|uniref:Uncharacterized protein n=1 Tax=Phormidesmis priestleyi ULC007 TaxID=1920490 RepID=A0A2T1D633_9CYAN|nr:hypothetical protein C7B65_23270 [Phormidesmis priestleyi ULC007]PZO53493.1 MAG: hypothetical protein DCF14_03615 [Phormidesmis priestleyi]